MKEVIIPIVSISVCSALLITALVNDKFKSNVRVITSLIIALFVISQFQDFDFNEFKSSFKSDISETDIFTPISTEVEEIINKTLFENITAKYSVNELYIDTNGHFSENKYEISDITIKIDTEEPLSEILTYVEDEFGLKGKVRVVKLTDEVNRIYEVE